MNEQRQPHSADFGTENRRFSVDAQRTRSLIAPFRDNKTPLVVTPTGQVLSSKSEQVRTLQDASHDGQLNLQQIGLNQRSF
jgi:hypothetical protein